MSGEQPQGTRAPDPDLGPGNLSTRGLPTARRGYEKKAVDALIADAVERWSALHHHHAELLEQVAKVGGADHLARDLGAIGAEVGRILEAANDAATSLRDRAHEDAERVRSEAAEEADRARSGAAVEAEHTVAEAERQAFELRREAWEASTALVESAAAKAASVLADANEEMLRLRAEGEREAHRRLASTRKETDDLVRSARFEAERQLVLARELAREIVERAAGGDEISQRERDQRIRAVMDEIERLRAEHAIEDVSVLPAEPAPERGFGQVDFSDDLAAEVGRLRDVIDLPRPESAARSAPGVGGRAPDGHEIGTLFEALRTTAESEVVAPRESDGEDDPIGLRDRALLVLHNAALRDVKRRITDLQQLALDVAGGSGWSPSADVFGTDLASLLDPFIARAAAFGAESARKGVGVAPKVDVGPRVGTLVSSMATDLASQLRTALSTSGGGPEEAASALRRVFRAWRTDEAERWVGMILIAAFHHAYLASLAAGGFDRVRGVPSGAPCRDCLGAAAAVWDPASPPSGKGVPPVDPDCRCTFEVLGK
jgi:F0F1-type ATP synthase membrane subunit b/b'